MGATLPYYLSQSIWLVRYHLWLKLLLEHCLLLKGGISKFCRGVSSRGVTPGICPDHQRIAGGLWKASPPRGQATESSLCLWPRSSPSRAQRGAVMHRILNWSPSQQQPLKVPGFTAQDGPIGADGLQAHKGRRPSWTLKRKPNWGSITSSGASVRPSVRPWRGPAYGGLRGCC